MYVIQTLTSYRLNDKCVHLQIPEDEENRLLQNLNVQLHWTSSLFSWHSNQKRRRWPCFSLEMPPQLYFLINWLQSCKNSTVHYKKLLVQQIWELQKQCNSTVNGHFYRYLMLMFYTQYKDSIHLSLHPYLTVIVSPDCFFSLSFQTNFLSAHFLLFWAFFCADHILHSVVPGHKMNTHFWTNKMHF